MPECEIRTVVVGGVGVGKSGLVSALLVRPFPERHVPTRARQLHHPAVMVNERVFCFQLADLPGVSQLPASAEEEWATAAGWGLRSAHAYILVFDLSQLQTFQVVSRVYSQLEKSSSSAAIVVVGTKQDLLLSTDENRELSRLVRKQWRRAYVEVSGKWNCGVVGVFQHLLCQLDKDIKKSTLPALSHPRRPSAAAESRCRVM